MMDQEKSFHLQVPGKTFLVGEYLALAGGPSVVATTRPCFEFTWSSRVDTIENRTSKSQRIQHSFHPDSPAGRLLNDLQVRLPGTRGFDITFQDPHFGKGGLGASTAEFIGAWIFELWQTSLSFQQQFQDLMTSGARLDLVEALPNHIGEIMPRWGSERVGSGRFRDLLDRYFQYVTAGSGADLVSQVTGGIAVWDGVHDQMRRFNWPFSDLSMSLFKTGRKLATHEHLASSVQNQGKAGPESVRERGLGSQLEPAFEDDMREWVKEAVQSLATSDADRFIASVRGTGRLLADSGRLASHSQTILDELADVSLIRAAKGCGAMGSDVILVLHDPGDSSAQFLDKFATAHGLAYAGSEADLHHDGLSLEVKG